MTRTGRPARDFWSRVNKSEEPNGCWLWTGPVNDKGYGVAWYGGRSRRAHQIAYILTFGPIPDGHVVCHSCDVRNCVKPLHLFSATQAENVADMDRKGRGRRIPPVERATGDRHWSHLHPHLVLRGERNGRTKLTAAQVDDIRIRRAADGATHAVLAREFGVSRSRIQQIVGTGR